MKREDVEGTIKSMAYKYSKPHFIFKNYVRVGFLGNHLVIRFYKDGFTVKGVDGESRLDTVNIKYDSVNKLAQFFNVLYILCDEAELSITF